MVAPRIVLISLALIVTGTAILLTFVFATFGHLDCVPALESSKCTFWMKVMVGPASMLRENEDVKEFYLGVAVGSRRSFRQVKSYKRRKRWLA